MWLKFCGSRSAHFTLAHVFATASSEIAMLERHEWYMQICFEEIFLSSKLALLISGIKNDSLACLEISAAQAPSKKRLQLSTTSLRACLIKNVYCWLQSYETVVPAYLLATAAFT